MKIYKLTIIFTDAEQLTEDEIVTVVEHTDYTINDKMIFPLVVDIDNVEMSKDAIDRYENAGVNDLDTAVIDTAVDAWPGVRMNLVEEEGAG